MKRHRGVYVVVVALLAIATAACSPQASTKKERDVSTPFPINFDRSIFDENSTTIDNAWFPLKPGTQMTWEGSALEGDEKIRRKVVFTVTDLTKEVAGVRLVVGWDRDYNNGELSESELIFFAQDKEGNVWHFGELVEHYEEAGHYAGTRVWMVGLIEGVKAGIQMKATPQLGAPEYSQGFAPHPWDWDDHAKVYRMGQRTCVRTGCYSDVLVMEEFEPAIPGISQLKYYARGVGNVRVGWLGEEDEEQESMELVKNVTLTAAALAEARVEALAMERRANTYSLIQPAVQQRTDAATPSP